MHLYDLWFLAIAVLWIGYFFLEGFDFGVGVLLKLLAGDEADQRTLIETIGPVWDGNEVWLITAGGATFAAFPEWYASLFSGLYLPLLVILIALIVRGVSIEYREHHDSASWRAGWTQALFWGSLLPALLWGLVFGNIVRGVPLDRRHVYVGSLGDLLGPYAILTAFTTLCLFTTHGAIFAAIRTTGELRDRARALVVRLGPVAALLAVVQLAWTASRSQDHRGWMIALAVLAAVAFLAALALTALGRDGWAFTLSGATIVLAVGALFVALYPRVLPSTVQDSFSLTVQNASATHLTLEIMTWVAVVFLPIVLIYQGWTYWVFRKRVTVRPEPT